MKRNELRAFNLVNYIDRSGPVHVPAGFPVVVHTIGLFEVETLPIGINPANVEKMNIIKIADLSPIPLTEEILLKAGFEKIPHFTVTNSLIFDIGRNRQLSIGCVGTPNELLFLCQYDKNMCEDIIAIHNFDYDGKLYLHKLQNIVLDLSGKELKVKL